MTPFDTQKDVEKVFPHLICILWSEYHTINSLTINNGTLRLINFLNSSQWSSLSKALLASKNVTNTVVDLFLYNSIYSLKVYIQEQFAEVLGNINRAECGSEVNAAVKSINEIFLCCAEPYKTHVNNFHGKKCSKQSARWYDDDCHKLRAKYNSHGNKFRKSEGQRDKMSRDEAKKEYVTLCKRKSAAFEKEQSELLLKCKYTDSNTYWQQIKPRSTKNEPCHVSLDEFKTHFEQLYVTSSDINNCNLSDNYLSWNPILDRPFSVCEISAALKHLKEGKSPGDDNVKSEFILCDDNNLKHVLTFAV